MTDIAVIVGAIVYTRRVRRALTQAELAGLAGLHPMALSKIERGVQRDIGIATLERLGRALELKASELLGTAEQWQSKIEQTPALHGLAGQQLAHALLETIG